MSNIDNQHIKNNFITPLNDIYTKLSKEKQPLTPEETAAGQQKVREYYNYLSQQGVKYGNIALDVLDKRTSFGQTANIHLETAAKVNGYDAAGTTRIMQEYPIYLAFSDAKMRTDKDFELSREASNIANYHYDGLKNLYDLPKESWGGALFEEFGGSGSWMRMSGYDMQRAISLDSIVNAVRSNEVKNGVNANKAFSYLLHTQSAAIEQSPSLLQQYSLGTLGAVPPDVFDHEHVSRFINTPPANSFLEWSFLEVKNQLNNILLTTSSTSTTPTPSPTSENTKPAVLNSEEKQQIFGMLGIKLDPPQACFAPKPDGRSYAPGGGGQFFGFFDYGKKATDNSDKGDQHKVGNDKLPPMTLEDLNRVLKMLGLQKQSMAQDEVKSTPIPPGFFSAPLFNPSPSPKTFSPSPSPKTDNQPVILTQQERESIFGILGLNLKLPQACYEDDDGNSPGGGRKPFTPQNNAPAPKPTQERGVFESIYKVASDFVQDAQYVLNQAGEYAKQFQQHMQQEPQKMQQEPQKIHNWYSPPPLLFMNQEVHNLFMQYQPAYIQKPIFMFDNNMPKNRIAEPTWIYDSQHFLKNSYSNFHLKEEVHKEVKACLATSCLQNLDSIISDVFEKNGINNFQHLSEKWLLAMDIKNEASLLINYLKTSIPGKWITPLRQELGYAASHVSPLVFDLEGNGLKLLPYTQGVYFDIDNDGFLEKIGWAAAEEGQLARDINGNGQIDDITELFGDDLISAFFKLSLLDSNSDKVIDEQDEEFQELLIWQDKNSNGYSEPEELKTLTAAGIKSISLTTKQEDKVIEGNTITESANFTYQDGRQGTIFDVHYHNDDMNSWYKGRPRVSYFDEQQSDDNEQKFTQELLKEVFDLLHNPDKITFKHSEDWLAEIIKTKMAYFLSKYQEQQVQKLDNLLKQTNIKFKLKLFEYSQACNTKEEQLSKAANSIYSEKNGAALDNLLLETQQEYQDAKEKINNLYTEEYKKAKEPKTAAYLEARKKIAEEKQKEFDEKINSYLNQLNSRINDDVKQESEKLLQHHRNIQSTQQKYDEAVAAVKQDLTNKGQAEYKTHKDNLLKQLSEETAAAQDDLEKNYDAEIKILRTEYTQLASEAISKRFAEYQEAYNSISESKKEALRIEMRIKLEEEIGEHQQKCSAEKQGLKELLSEQYQKQKAANEEYTKQLEAKLQIAANNLYAFISQEILIKVQTQFKTAAEQTIAAPEELLPDSYIKLTNYYNAFIRTQNITTITNDDNNIKIDPETLFMPMMRGYGKMPALHIAMSENNQLKTMVAELMVLRPSDLANIYTKIVNILYEWAGVRHIAEDERRTAEGNNIEARKVAFVEQVTGQQFKQLGAANFVGQHASTAVQKAWDIALIKMMQNLLVQGPFLAIFPNAEYIFSEDIIKLNSSLDEILTKAKNFANVNKLSYDFWVQLGYILVGNLAELNTSLENINMQLSKLAGEPIMLNLGEFALVGDAGDNTIKGTSGSDYIKGMQGNDKLYGRAGSDHIEGGEGDDAIFGDDGIDRLYGNAGNDRMYGGDGRDFMYGGDGNDEMYGEEDDDHIEGGAGADFMDGGEGIDTLSYGESPVGVNINLAEGTAHEGDAEGDRFQNFENLGGSEFDDVLHGDDQDNYINGEGGNDHLYGGKGNDYLFGAKGNDHLYGEEGDDTLIGFEGYDYMDGGDGKDTVSYHHPYATQGVIVDLKAGKGYRGHAGGDTYQNIENIRGSKFNDRLTGDDNDNILQGMEGDDIIHGNGGDDVIMGGTGNNLVFGDEGDDHVLLGFGADIAYGGEGEDTISYARAPAGVVINMVEGKGTSSIINEDKFFEFENAIGSKYDDTIYGDNQDNKLFGLDGNDTIYGGKGDDIINGGAGDDELYGEEGDDTIIASEGSDTIDGGDGRDTVSYTQEKLSGIKVNLATGKLQGGIATNHKLRNIENIIGTDLDDTLIGDSSDNTLQGNGGDDYLDGGAGNDILAGGKGKNTLIGGEGSDQFIGGEGSDNMSGGIGVDFVVYKKSKSGIEVRLSEGRGFKGDAIDDTYIEIEGVVGSEFDDIIIGDDNANYLYGGDGDDYIDGGGWNDVISGGKGNNTLKGGRGADKFLLVEGNNNVDGGEGEDTISYESYRQAEYDLVWQTELAVRQENNTLPIISHQLFSDPQFGDKTGLVLDLRKGSISKLDGSIDQFVSIENIIGTSFDDLIYGDDGDNILTGVHGNDNIYGGNGDDIIVSGRGISNLYGEEGNDTFVIKAPVANIYGGTGINSVNFISLNIPVSIDLRAQQITYHDLANTTHLSTIKDVSRIQGTNLADIIYDDGNDNVIVGGGGNDIIYLSGGNDLVNGGGGKDIIHLTGNGTKQIWGGLYESDTFVIDPNLQTIDRLSVIICDYEAGISGDKIDLTAFPHIQSLHNINITEYIEAEQKYTLLPINDNIWISLYGALASNLIENNFIFAEL